jgi:hypothetical protein
MSELHVTGAVIEWAPFRLAPGVTESALLEASERFQRDFLAGQPGFLRRELLRGRDGQWIDLVLWQDQASADAIMAAATSSPHCAAYFEVMDMSGVDPAAGVSHFSRLRHYAKS